MEARRKDNVFLAIPEAGVSKCFAARCSGSANPPFPKAPTWALSSFCAATSDSRGMPALKTVQVISDFERIFARSNRSKNFRAAGSRLRSTERQVMSRR